MLCTVHIKIVMYYDYIAGWILCWLYGIGRYPQLGGFMYCIDRPLIGTTSNVRCWKVSINRGSIAYMVSAAGMSWSRKNSTKIGINKEWWKHCQPYWSWHEDSIVQTLPVLPWGMCCEDSTSVAMRSAVEIMYIMWIRLLHSAPARCFSASKFFDGSYCTIKGDKGVLFAHTNWTVRSL